MRYAAPPLGNLRWRAPAEPVRSDPGTVEKATTYPPICLGIGVPYPAEGQSEDCLFVNVWAPTNATVTSKLPVWVFIQGGGYVANTNANWNGAEAVERSGHNIIMVNFNYRVGLWGFLASERVREDGALNAGLLDQRMLLKWVKEHIAAFGGDPNHVVIHGASAGAGSVAMQLLTYGGRNDRLFVGAMAEAIFFPAQPLVSELEYQFNRIVNQTGCGSVSSARQMECLRSRDTAVLQAANYAQPFPGRSEPPMPLFYFTPCVDGDFLRDLPYKLFENGQFIRVPMVLGTSTDEGSLFAPNAATQSDMAIFLQNNYPLLTENDTTAILSHYPQLPPLPAHNPWFPTASKAYGEATFICPQHNVQTYLDITANSRNATNRLYTYRYNVLDSENLAAGLGVPHLFDAAAIFGPDALPAARASYKTYNAGVVPLLMGYWLSFVRTLDPNRHRMPGSPVWEAWDHRSTKRLVIETVGARMDGGDDGEKERCRFWLGLGRGRMRQRRSV
ncbi:alpha/beta-hydrolase [Parathielavia appendiculata]|uniref:Carboxylic ester hydrolase n=1 Tax=Parathielavia appendiculata TaxID=2587402 RepID=A0AAN6UBA9_9PEZI|nr:alpha/beta-hydrolase [Parathielavia appendiculata]